MFSFCGFSIFSFFFFFFNDTATTEIYTLSLHDALPICGGLPDHLLVGAFDYDLRRDRNLERDSCPPLDRDRRSEEHTSELQSHVNLVCRLLLEKKKRGRDISAQTDGSRTRGTD